MPGSPGQAALLSGETSKKGKTSSSPGLTGGSSPTVSEESSRISARFDFGCLGPPVKPGDDVSQQRSRVLGPPVKPGDDVSQQRSRVLGPPVEPGDDEFVGSSSI